MRAWRGFIVAFLPNQQAIQREETKTHPKKLKYIWYIENKEYTRQKDATIFKIEIPQKDDYKRFVGKQRQNETRQEIKRNDKRS